jgi:hypothetical protein
MEDAMPGIRIVTVGAALMATVVSAAAQNSAPTPAGQPIQLLQILEKPNKPAKTKRHVRTTKRHKPQAVKPSAPAKAPPAAAPDAPETANAAADPWPPETEPVLLQPMPNVVEVGGQTVKLVPADEVNEIDLAADAQRFAALANTVEPAVASDAVAASLEALPEPAVPAPPERRWSWLVEALAALGGAVAAASAAWFLIGARPLRRYG